MALRADRSIGDQGEQQAVALLVERGYLAELFGNRNNPIYDIQVGGRGPFRISVKTSRTKQQVCLGKLNSVKQLAHGDFVFAFMPAIGTSQIDFDAGSFRLLIIPAEQAREDTLELLNSYCQRKGFDAETFSSYLLVKKKHDVWDRWSEFENAWQFLPEFK